MKIFGNSIITKKAVISVGDHEKTGFAVKKSANLSLINNIHKEETYWKKYTISPVSGNKQYYFGFKASKAMGLGIKLCDGIQNEFNVMTIWTIPGVRYSIPIKPRYNACLDLGVDVSGEITEISLMEENKSFVPSENISVEFTGYPMRGTADARDYFEIVGDSVTYTQCLDLVDGALIKLENPITKEVKDEELSAGLIAISKEKNIESMNCVPLGGIEE